MTQKSEEVEKALDILPLWEPDTTQVLMIHMVDVEQSQKYRITEVLG